MKRFASVVVALVMVLGLFMPINANAASKNNEYNLGGTPQKKDSGYDEDKTMKDNDVHYGWELGHFQVTGFTRKQEMDDGSPLFIKNVGDTISLSFLLDQDIEALNGEDNVFISEDTNGYDTYFGITKDKKTNFGKGTLLVKYTDYKNDTTNIQPYVDYLNGVKKGAETDVQFFDEGDYEIALDYEIRKNNINVWKVKTAPSYDNYQILTKFSIRNGNCMVYPFDIKTKSELVNASFTENGFYLDLARSRYLMIDVKKMNYTEAEGGLSEDVRFNKPASDGEEFTDEGVYVITVKNKYTKSETEKKIYVGTDKILKAYVTTGKDIDYIKEMVADGATIEDDGTITLPTNEVIEDETEEVEIEEEPTEVTVDSDTEHAELEESGFLDNERKVVLVVVLVVGVGIFIITRIKKKNKSPMVNDETTDAADSSENMTAEEDIKTSIEEEEESGDEGGDIE